MKLAPPSAGQFINTLFTWGLEREKKSSADRCSAGFQPAFDGATRTAMPARSRYNFFWRSRALRYKSWRRYAAQGKCRMIGHNCWSKNLLSKPKFNCLYRALIFSLAAFALCSTVGAQETHRVFTTIQLDSAPVASWVTPNDRKLVITTGDDQVLFYDLRLARVISRLRLDGSLLFIHVLPGDKLALIGHWGGRRISLIDLYGNRFVRSIPVGGGPTFFGQFPRGVLVLMARDQKLSFLSPYSFRPVKEVAFSAPAAGLAVAPQRGYAYVAVGMQQIAVVDLVLKKVARTFNVVTARDTPLVVDPRERWLFAFGPRNSVVRISLDEERESKHISTGSGPAGMEMSGDGKYLYVTNGLEGKLAIFDVESLTELEQIPVGVKPASVNVSRDNRYVFVCNRGSRSISILERQQTNPSPGPQLNKSTVIGHQSSVIVGHRSTVIGHRAPIDRM